MQPRPATSDIGLAGSAGFIVSLGCVLLAVGAILAVVRYAGGTPSERGFEGVMGAWALGVVVAAPGILALLGLVDRPALLLPAAIVLVPLSFLSFAGVLLPLLIPAGMLFVAYGRRSSVHVASRARAVLSTPTVLLLLVAAVVALFVHDDPRQYSTPSGGGSTSDVISITESLISLALVTAAIAAGWLLTTPHRRSADTESSCRSASAG